MLIGLSFLFLVALGISTAKFKHWYNTSIHISYNDRAAMAIPWVFKRGFTASEIAYRSPVRFTEWFTPTRLTRLRRIGVMDFDVSQKPMQAGGHAYVITSKGEGVMLSATEAMVTKDPKIEYAKAS